MGAISARKGKGKGGKGKGGRNDEGTCNIEPEDMDYVMSVAEGCMSECYGDFMTTGGGYDYGNYGTGSGYDYGTGSGFAVGRNGNANGYGMGIVQFAEAYTCPMHCMLEGLDLTYEEDGWPSTPKITDFFADSPMNPDQIGKCLCEGMKAKPMRVLKELAQMGDAGEEMMAGRSAYPNMRGDDFDPAMLEGIIDITELPQMYKELDDQEKDYVRDLIRFAVFNHCIHDSYIDVCPHDFTSTGPTGANGR